jgi:hypothetical protein
MRISVGLIGVACIFYWGSCMGVNHGENGGTNPPELAVGDANTSYPPRFLSYFKISSARHRFVPPDFNPDLRHWGPDPSLPFLSLSLSLPSLSLPSFSLPFLPSPHLSLLPSPTFTYRLELPQSTNSVVD